MCGAAVSFPAWWMGMEMEMDPVLSRSSLTKDRLVMVKHIVITNVSPSRIDIVINVVDTEPVVYPAATRGIAHTSSKRLGHRIAQHQVDFVPGIVVGKQLGCCHLLYGCLSPSTIYLAFLKSPQEFDTGFKVEVKDLANTLECGFDRFVERSFGIKAMDDVNCFRHLAHWFIGDFVRGFYRWFLPALRPS